MRFQALADLIPRGPEMRFKDNRNIRLRGTPSRAAVGEAAAPNRARVASEIRAM